MTIQEQKSGGWVVYYPNRCPYMDEEGIPILWGSEESALLIADSLETQEQNGTGRVCQ